MDLPSSDKQTILLVDDELSLREVMKYMLAQAGYQVLVAENGKRALEIYQQQTDAISVVVMDLMLPDMYGTDCLQGILATNPQAKVIVCSGFAGTTETEEVLAKGAKACLEKPFTTDELASVIRVAIEER